MARPVILISRCLLGDPVRYNGGVVKADWITELRDRADLVAICPELEMGLPVPREAMRLARPAPGAVQLRTSRTAQDMTGLATDTCARLLAGLPAVMDGAVLTGRSPLCGVERVKVYDRQGVPQAEGEGFFARALREHRPDVATIDAGRLTVEAARAHYLLWVETRSALRSLPPKAAALQAFHRRHKFLLLATGRVHLEKLGRIVADADPRAMAPSIAAYRAGIDVALRQPLKRRAMADAMMHVYGFVKDRLDDKRREALRRAIDDYRLGVSKSVKIPLALLRFSNADDAESYVTEQILLQGEWRAEPVDDA